VLELTQQSGRIAALVDAVQHHAGRAAAEGQPVPELAERGGGRTHLVSQVFEYGVDRQTSCVHRGDDRLDRRHVDMAIDRLGPPPPKREPGQDGRLAGARITGHDADRLASGADQPLHDVVEGAVTTGDESVRRRAVGR
jgi:hypothetical protein